MQKLGVNVALGTDASINNNTNNMLNEMYHCTMYHKLARSNPTVLPAKQVFRMATVNGAKTMGRDDIGTIQEGKKADLVFYNMKSFAFIPFYGDLFSNLVYNAPNIRAHSVMVNGKFILKDYKLLTIDESKVKEKVMQLSNKVYDALKKVKKL
jgi:5-methylthioadenosine/S-adenosylhomocysteine deaminase